MSFMFWYCFGLFVQVERNDIDDPAQICSNSSALAMELLQSCAKPSMS